MSVRVWPTVLSAGPVILGLWFVCRIFDRFASSHFFANVNNNLVLNGPFASSA